MLEAHSRQLPILAADAASNREIAGNAAFYFDPHDLDDLATKLLALLRNGDTPGPLPRVYDWDTCADQTANVLLTAPRH
jgi:glycosyltransferase involved in cell wall biosynthesis